MFDALARWATHRAPFTLILVAPILAVAIWFGTPLADQLGGGLPDFTTPGSKSSQASEGISDATGVQGDGGVLVMVELPDGKEAASSADKVADVQERLADTDGVASTLSAYRGGPPTMFSEDGKHTYVLVNLEEDVETHAAVTAIEDDLDGLDGVLIGGSPVVDVQVVDTVKEDLARAELAAFPVLFVLSLFIFRSLVASALPVLMGGLNIVLTLLVLRGVNEYYELSIFALNLVTALGLGLAIDYSLLVVSRFRSERAAGASVEAAVATTVRTAGHTIAFSAATVSASLAALLICPQRFLRSMAIAGGIVTLLAAVVAIFVLPAGLRLIGSRIDWLSPKRWQRRLEQPHDRQGGWFKLAERVVARPIVTVLAALVLMAGLGSVAFGAKFTFISASNLPESASARQVDDILRAEFDYQPQDDITVVIKTDDAKLAQRIRDDIVSLPGHAEVSPVMPLDAETQLVAVQPDGTALADSARDLVADIRALDTGDAELTTGGLSSIFVDMRSSLIDRLPWVIGVICLANLLVLTFLTRSFVLPIASLLMNTLTVGATFGALVLIFQDGHGAGLLGTTGQGALDLTQPVLLFALVFGLSTDYGVFILAAVKEAREAGASDREAVILGMGRTGRVVTAAALLFCVALGALATSSLVFIKELGFGTAFGVLIDATIVRVLLVPSLMVLMGWLTWAAPAWVRGQARKLRPMPRRAMGPLPRWARRQFADLPASLPAAPAPGPVPPSDVDDEEPEVQPRRRALEPVP